MLQIAALVLCFEPVQSKRPRFKNGELGDNRIFFSVYPENDLYFRETLTSAGIDPILQNWLSP